ncbi:MAG: glycosyltransferase family 39 protein [Mariprofundaceae bacterium]
MLERFERNPLPLLLGLALVNFLFMLGGHSLWDVDEPNNAVCAREMLAVGNWWVPMFNGDLRFDKPILLYWLMMPAYSLFGINEFSARLPSAMAITALTGVVWYFTRRLLDARSALIAALLLVSSLHMAVISRAATPDPLLILCVGFTLLALLCVYVENEGGRLLIAAYVAMGIGVLAKGPVAVLMPGLVMGLFLLLMGEWRSWRRFRPFMGLAIILGIALPWYVTVGVLTGGEWLEGFLLHHNIDRFTQPLQGHRGFPGFYVLTVLLGWFPWSGLLASVLLFGVWRLRGLRQQPMRLFLLCWIVVFLVFFTVARTQLPNYMLPVFPAAAVLMALWLRDADEFCRRKAFTITAWTAAVMGIGLLIGGGVALQLQWPGDGVYAIFLLPLCLAAVAWLWKGQGAPLLPIALGMALTVALLTAWSIPGLDKHKISPRLADAASAVGFGGDALATFRYFQPALLYYHGGRLPLLGDVQALGDWLVAGKAVVMPSVSLAELPQEILPFLVIHDRAFGMYARKELLLLSLAPIEEK